MHFVCCVTDHYFKDDYTPSKQRFKEGVYRGGPVCLFKCLVSTTPPKWMNRY